MSRNPTAAELAATKTAEARAILTAQNKEQARAHLLQIQLLLARRPVPTSK